MRPRIIYTVAGIFLALLVALLIWQGSFSFGEFGPTTPEQVFVYWAISTLIFILTVLLGFILARDSIKLYFQRRAHQDGSSIRTKLVLGALALSVVPAIFLVLFSYQVLNVNLKRWFTFPAENVKTSLIGLSNDMDAQVRLRSLSAANWLASIPETRAAMANPDAYHGYFTALCKSYSIGYLALEPDFGPTVFYCGAQTPSAEQRPFFVRAKIPGAPSGEVLVAAEMPIPIAKKQDEIERYLADYEQIHSKREQVRSLYIQVMALITLFVLFVATWIAFLLARQLSIPISALLEAAAEVRKGNLAYRVTTPAMDELGTLVRGFNEMVQELEANSRELESRRKFTEAILESVPTGVLSVTSDGTIQRANRAARGLFTEDRVVAAGRLEDLFTRDDTAEIKYLMKRARRTGVAATQMELRQQAGGAPLHLAVTVAALEERLTSGFVIVLEDTSDLLRAQKSAAWHEVARRIAHELKNPLTPISLCSERITRQLDRGAPTPESTRILRECSITIARELESVKNLVNEFSDFARFPSAQPAPNDLNQVVHNALAVFEGRLAAIDLSLDLAPGLPLVNLDPEQMKRVVINLVDNAAEAMLESPVKRLWITTRLTDAENVELSVADSGPGISTQDKAKLFLPYFSTKERGTGLGLAIVNQVIHEHHASIRVIDNKPAGACFVVDLPVIPAAEPAIAAATEARA